MTATNDKKAAASKPDAGKSKSREKFAKVRVLQTGTRLGQMVFSKHYKPLVVVPFADAEFKESRGAVKIMEVFEA